MFMRQAQLHRMRRIIRELVDMLPEEQKHSPRVKELASWSCTTTMHLLEINAQAIEGETNARDYDFSRAAVQARWRAGYADTCRMLERGPWNDPIDPATEITVYQSDAPA
jgi:NTE family protein